MSDFHTLKVAEVESLTPNSVAISFEIPADLKQTFAFSAGQYITLRKELEGEAVRRAYSISSSTEDELITIGVKKVPDGQFSVYANTSIQQGDMLEVMPPEGRFIYEPGSGADHVVAFAAGSGITPIMSIIRKVLGSHPQSTMVLLYGNQNREETMFHEAILRLKEEYGERFFVQFIYSRAREEDGLFGRIEASTVNYIVKNKFKERDFGKYYICGPEAMIHTVADTLKEKDVDEELIFTELFTTSESDDVSYEAQDGLTEISVRLEDEDFTFSMDRNALVLDAVLDQDIDAPYSCQGGVCSTCIARVTEGKAIMEQNQILTDSEVEEGLILTCQAHPTTDTLKIDYDDV